MYSKVIIFFFVLVSIGCFSKVKTEESPRPNAGTSKETQLTKLRKENKDLVAKVLKVVNHVKQKPNLSTIDQNKINEGVEGLKKIINQRNLVFNQPSVQENINVEQGLKVYLINFSNFLFTVKSQKVEQPTIHQQRVPPQPVQQTHVPRTPVQQAQFTRPRTQPQVPGRQNCNNSGRNRGGMCNIS